MTTGTGTTPTIVLPKPLPHQLPILLSPARFKIAVCGRRFGKTAIGLLMTIRGHGPHKGALKGAMDGGNIWWVGPTYQITQIIWRHLKRACRPIWEDKSESSHRIEFPGGGSITVKSAENPDSLVGDGLDGVVMDEAAQITQEAWTQSIRPALADKRGWACFIGTPKGMNWFYDMFQNAATTPGWERWQRPSTDNPLLTEEELYAARVDMGDLQFNQEFGADFLSGTGMMFRREYFQIIEEVPRGLDRVVRYYDVAGTQDGGDYTAGVLIAARRDPLAENLGPEHDEYFVLDCRHGQWAQHDRDRVVDQTIRLDHKNFGGRLTTWFEQMPNPAGKEAAYREVRRYAGFNVRVDPVTASKGNKEVRARPWAGILGVGAVRVLNAPWTRAFIEEHCFADGTPIVTMRGIVPIQGVTTNDFVVTRAGWRRVLNSACTNRSAIVCKIVLEDSSVLLTTPNHPILVPNYGFVRAGRLRVGDVLLRYIGVSDLCRIQSDPCTSREGLMGSIGICTSMYGNVRSGRCLADTTSTTKTKTHKTTHCGTCVAGRQQSTYDTTAYISQEGGCLRGCVLYAGVSFLVRQERGLTTAGVGAVAYRKLTGGYSIDTPEGALYAGPSSRHIAATKSTVVEYATTRIRLDRRGRSVRMLDRSNLVCGAGDCIPRIRNRDFAANAVVSAIHMLQERRPVYNLEVEEYPEYVAGGVLVHNCTFPHGKHDDMVDAAAGAYSKIAVPRMRFELASSR